MLHDTLTIQRVEAHQLITRRFNKMQNIEVFFIAIAVTVGVFLLLREVFCWYFKINARLDVSKQILAELKKNNEDKDPS